MKKKLLALILAGAMAISFAGCMGEDMDMTDDGQQNIGNDGTLENDPQAGDNADTGTDTSMQSGMQQSANLRSTKYSENDVEFDIPDAWQNNFLATAQEHNPDIPDQSYSTVDFYYTMPNSAPLKVMTIGRFTKAAWDKMTASAGDAANKMLGKSKDGEWVYSLNYEEGELSEDEAYLKVREEVKNLKDKIKITK